MKKIGLILLILLVAFLPACSSQNRQTFEKNQALWKSQAIQHYSFNFKIGCNCPWYSLMPLAVEVQNGGIVSIVASNGGDISPYLDSFRPYATIENLFDVIYAAMSRGAYKLDVNYNGTYGFPTSIIVNPSKAIMDDEKGYYVTDFEVLP